MQIRDRTTGSLCELRAKILGCETCITPAIAATRACPNCRSHDIEGIRVVRGLEFLSQLKTEISKNDGTYIEYKL